MKKLMIGTLCVMFGMAAFASSSYQIYKFQLNAKTTDAKGVISTSCDDTYAYRDKRTVTIKGVLGGCGCGAINADGVCNNAILYMWDVTRGIAITNVETITPWTIQRVGKSATVVENYAAFKATYGDDNRYSFEIMLAGFGAYKINKNDPNASYVSSVSGNFAGTAVAPIYVKHGTCTACSIEPDEAFVTTAYSPCLACEDNETFGEVTPFFGTYVLKYDSSSSKVASKHGLSTKVLGLPAYMQLTDYAASNISE